MGERWTADGGWGGPQGVAATSGSSSAGCEWPVARLPLRLDGGCVRAAKGEKMARLVIIAIVIHDHDRSHGHVAPLPLRYCHCHHHIIIVVFFIAIAIVFFSYSSSSFLIPGW